MIDKMETQLELARIIRAVDERDVAERVINTHFLPDLIGDMRAFSRQKVRCVKCKLQSTKAAHKRKLSEMRRQDDAHRPRRGSYEEHGTVDKSR